MSISRRRLLHYTGAGCALVLLAPASAMTAGSLRRYEVRDDVALPRFAAGATIVADTAMTRFSGPGLYLYPAWGAPRLYDVRAAGAMLEFRNPGTGQLLWKQAAAYEAAFAGRAQEEVATALACPPLCVPAVPDAGIRAADDRIQPPR